ncbi:hypothetical protein EYF80_043464 [Liparis tanakae]|uniref:Uncharacterized protein n=1 Tax=Liparis tanakae TaxID=230148 RepID=A0A4Z2FYH5_9TELE|nr:hypothetical protein EYF80_043464 [Liparis tanakae]
MSKHGKGKKQQKERKKSRLRADGEKNVTDLEKKERMRGRSDRRRMIGRVPNLCNTGPTASFSIRGR